MTEELDPSVQHARQALLEEITQRVTREHSGDDPELVRTALKQAIEEAGFPQQPEKWVGDTASEIAAGRHVVVDRKLMAGRSGGDGVRPEPDEDGDLHVRGGNTGDDTGDDAGEEHHPGLGERVKGLLHRHED